MITHSCRYMFLELIQLFKIYKFCKERCRSVFHHIKKAQNHSRVDIFAFVECIYLSNEAKAAIETGAAMGQSLNLD